MYRGVWFGIAIVLCLALIGCSKSPSETIQVNQLRFGVLPDQAPDALKARYTGLLDYLSKETGIRCELVLTNDYQDLLERFHTKQVDVARFGGFSFVKARARDGAIPLVMRDVDTRFVSYFLVNSNSTAKSVQEFKGRSLAFGAQLSTSGHLMPRYFLQQDGIKPEEFFSEVHYSGAHDRTAEWVAQGKVDLGVANAVVVDRIYAQGKLTQEQVRVLWRTPPYANYVWATRRDTPDAVRSRLLNAFLKLSTDTPEMAAVLKAVNADYYLPATVDDFTAIERSARSLDML